MMAIEEKRNNTKLQKVKKVEAVLLLVSFVSHSLPCMQADTLLKSLPAELSVLNNFIIHSHMPVKLSA